METLRRNESSLVCDLSVLDPETRAAHVALGTCLLGEAAELGV